MIVLVVIYGFLLDSGVTKLQPGLELGKGLDLKGYSCVHVFRDIIDKQKYIPLLKSLTQFISVQPSSGYRPEVLRRSPRSVIFLTNQSTSLVDEMRDTKRHLIILDVDYEGTSCENMKPSHYDVDFYCRRRGTFFEKYYVRNMIIRYLV